MEAIDDEKQQEEGMRDAIAYCDKIIAEGDEVERDFFSMVKRTLLDGESKFEDWL